MKKQKILVLLILVLLTFIFRYDNVNAAEAVCRYGNNQIKITVNIDDNVLNTSVGYTVGTNIESNELTVRNFQDNNGKLKCLSKIWYNVTVGTTRIGTVWVSYTQTDKAKYSLELIEETYVQDENEEETPNYDYVCKYGIHYLSFNNKNYDIQLSGGYSVSTVYFSLDDLLALNACPQKLYLVCTTRGGKFCAVSLTSLPYSSAISLTTDDVPNQEEIENPKPEESEPIPEYKDGCGIISEELGEKLKFYLDIVKYGGVILAIALGMLDYVKVIFSDESDASKKASKKFIKRLMAAAIIFIVPLILQVFLNILEIDGVDTSSPFCIRLE